MLNYLYMILVIWIETIREMWKEGRPVWIGMIVVALLWMGFVQLLAYLDVI